MGMLNDCRDDGERVIYADEYGAMEGRPEAVREKHAMTCVEIYRSEMQSLAHMPLVERQAMAKQAVDREREMRLGLFRSQMGRGRPPKVSRGPKLSEEALAKGPKVVPPDEWVPDGLPQNVASLRESILAWACKADKINADDFHAPQNVVARRLAALACVFVVKNRRLAAEILDLSRSSVGAMCTRAHPEDIVVASEFAAGLKAIWAKSTDP